MAIQLGNGTGLNHITGDVELNWTDSDPAAVSFRVTRNDYSNNDGDVVWAELDDHSFVDFAPANGDYAYHVQSLNSADQVLSTSSPVFISLPDERSTASSVGVGNMGREPLEDQSLSHGPSTPERRLSSVHVGEVLPSGTLGDMFDEDGNPVEDLMGATHGSTATHGLTTSHGDTRIVYSGCSIFLRTKYWMMWDYVYSNAQRAAYTKAEIAHIKAWYRRAPTSAELAYISVQDWRVIDSATVHC